MISLIAAIGENRELGQDNDLVFHIKEDMKYFKEITLGHPVVMGRKTFESLGHKPLPGRTNYVVTRRPEDLPSTVEPVRELKPFLESTAADSQEYFIIGGGMLYFEALPYAQNLYLTEVHSSAPTADTFFPAFDPTSYDKQIIKEGKDHDLAYSFTKYTKH